MSANSATVHNPFSAPSSTAASSVDCSAVARSDMERAAREVESAIAIAKRFPRDQMAAMDRIIQACTRISLAEHSLYAYPRGSEMVTGPSIRLAEAVAQNWGNLQFGIRELSQSSGSSTVEAFAWDVETNVRQTKVFQVAHVRHTRRGQYKLEDPRDIYEMVANQGARRLRACILGVIPGDVIDGAVRQCEVTIKNAAGAPAEQIEKLVEAFEPLGVTSEMLVRRLGHHLDSVIAAEVLSLRKIYQSITDGMAAVGEFFEVEALAAAGDSAPKKGAAALKAKVSGAADGSAKGSRKKPAGKAKGKTEEPTDSGESDPVGDHVPTFSFAWVAEALNKAADADALALAADMIGGVDDQGQREELSALYESRRAEIES